MIASISQVRCHNISLRKKGWQSDQTNRKTAAGGVWYCSVTDLLSEQVPILSDFDITSTIVPKLLRGKRSFRPTSRCFTISEGQVYSAPPEIRNHFILLINHE